LQVSLEELRNASWALSESVLPAQQKLRQVFEEHGLSKPHVALESRSLSVRLQAVVSSDLLAYTSRRMIEQAVAEGYAVTELPVQELVWRRRRRKCSFKSDSGASTSKPLHSANSWEEIADRPRVLH